MTKAMTPIERARQWLRQLEERPNIGEWVEASTPAVIAICRALIAAEERVQELERALADLFGMVETGALVRDTTGDPESGWAVKQLPLMMVLKAAQAALAKGKE